ncbi:NAD-dependent epimerase/dehydratase family protein [Pseudorhodoplanes sp.]|uniref:NAD-dependent epimerase/dehydratase family protein n=1 Tax=Pseudorhodoplanes sp. TaxID=1934341 RepID=UPI003D0DCD97
MIQNTEKFPKPDFGNKRVLVVGGAGFVGSNLVHRVLEDNPREIVVVDNLLSADVSNVPNGPRVRFVASTVTDDLVLGDLPTDLDYAFHLACYHGNQSSIADPIADHDNNNITSLKLFERLKDIRSLRKVVYAAAGCAVAKKTKDEPAATSEDAPVDLFHDSPYSISKLVGEMYGNYYFRRHKMPFAKARFQNVYGPREILGAGRWRGTPHTVWRNVTPTFIFKALHKEALPLINGGEDGRDFIYVGDLVEGLTRIAAYGEPGEAYNLASGRETRIRDLAALINKLTGNPTPPDIAPPRDWDNSGRRYGDPTKSMNNLGFLARTQIEEGLRQTIDWTRSHLEVIRRCMAHHADRVPEVKNYVA